MLRSEIDKSNIQIELEKVLGNNKVLSKEVKKMGYHMEEMQKEIEAQDAREKIHKKQRM